MVKKSNSNIGWAVMIVITSLVDSRVAFVMVGCAFGPTFKMPGFPGRSAKVSYITDLTERI